MRPALITLLLLAVSACGVLPASPPTLTTAVGHSESAAATPQPSPTPGKTTYDSLALGIMFEYPSSWILQVHPSEPVDLVLTSFDPANPPHKLAWDETTVKMSIRFLPAATAPDTLDKWKYYLLDEQHIDGNTLYISGEERLTLSSGSTLEHVTVASGSGGIFHFAYLILGDKHLEFGVEGPNFNQALDVLESIRPQPGATGPTSQPAGGNVLFLWVLKNAVYHSPDWGDFQLVNGTYFRTPDYPDASPQLFATQIFEPVAFGDLNGDGVEDAAVILQTYNGGNGDTKELAAVLNLNGAAYNVSTVHLGSMIALDSVRIQSGVITLSMRLHGPNDGMCCPSQVETWRFRLEDRLIRMP